MVCWWWKWWFGFFTKYYLSFKSQCLNYLQVSLEPFPLMSICCSKMRLNEVDCSDFLLQSGELKDICF